MQSFKDCLANCGLGTVRTVGVIFTWTNKCASNPIFKRLDRMVANGAWFNLFTERNAFIKPRGLMDHNAIIFEEPMQLQRVSKPFQFFNYMIDLPGFNDVVVKTWSLDCSGFCYNKFASRLKEAKLLLRQLNKNHGHVSSNVLDARTRLEELQVYMLNNGDPDLLALESELINKLNMALAEEESLFLQKSGVKWMGLGDGNNSFFHQQCKANWNHNKILALENDSGNLVYGQLPCADIAVSNFKNLLGSEILHPHIDLDSVYCKFLTELQGINSTLISIIPKVDSPTKMSDFRPISLCTVMYKCISKILAARLKLVMPSIIDIAQSSFVPGRSISDNILLAQELFRGYDRDT
ncbi:uncharacterized protein LOC141674037 [Apium graveolens]|uniref:uncharacterized protein LOC141674037 n=1 Tax=Apium graveolens TaxID=4045 RepID=UPI003D7ACFED